MHWSRYALIGMICANSAFAAERELKQFSVITGLMGGVYQGEMTYGELKKHGDFGIGTFDQLDGEMIAFDNEFYQIKADGKAYSVQDTQTTPFANVVYFDADGGMELPPNLSMKNLSTIEDSFPTRNYFYALRIDGTFKTVRTRSVPAQEKPYPTLTEVVKHQPIFDFANVEGTMVGYWFPAYVGGMNVPGFHFHFLMKDKKAGGHVLDFTADKATLQLMALTSMNVTLPSNAVFQQNDLSKVKPMDIHKVEK